MCLPIRDEGNIGQSGFVSGGRISEAAVAVLSGEQIGAGLADGSGDAGHLRELLERGGEDCGEVDVACSTRRKAPAAVGVLGVGEVGKGIVDDGEVGVVGGAESLEGVGGVEGVGPKSHIAAPGAFERVKHRD